MTTPKLLGSPVAKHLGSAVVAGAVVLVRPSRVPRSVRRGLLATNTAGTASSMLTGSSRNATPAPLSARIGPRAGAIGDTSNLVASLAGSVTLLTSKPALKLDAKAERALTRRGVRRPRLIMALGAAGATVVLGVALDKISTAAERKAAELQDEQAGTSGKASKINPPPGR